VSTGLICLEIVSKLNQVSLDIRAVIREYGLTEAELSPEELVRILKNKGFKAKQKKLHLKSLSKYPLPIIFNTSDGSYGVLLKLHTDEEKVLIFSPVSKQAEEKTYAEFEQLIAGSVIVVYPKLLKEQIRFGFKWFFI
jgi:ATP-binding cassette, subfamily B, bacterial HlyB/CyaB